MAASADRWKPSVTVAAVIERVVDGERRFLLVEEDTADGLRLNNPAGHLEEGESPVQGVVREVLEETACTFTPQCVVGLYLSRYRRPSTGEDVTYLRLAYGGMVGAPDPTRRLDDGIVRTLWMTLPELHASRERHRSALVLTCIEDYVAGKRHPLSVVHADATVFVPEIKR
jgi:8-oxo-dGTP pyrophosphatase MutT (NUDIX family)